MSEIHFGMLGDFVSEISGGGTPSREEPDYWNGDIPWASVKDLTSKNPSNTAESITEEGLSSSASRLIPAGTPIVATRMAVGRTAAFARDVAINQDLKAIFANPSLLDKNYLFQFLLGSEKLLASKGTGSTVKGIRLDDLLQLNIAVPPLPEQKKIAEILSGIEERIKRGEQRIARLEILLLSAGAKFFRSDSWQDMRTIGEIFEVSSGSTPSRSRQDYFCSNGGTPWVKTMDLNDEVVTTTDEQITNTAIHEGKARVFPRGTLLLAMYGGWNQIGRTGVLGQVSSCNQAMSALLPSEEVLPGFLNLQLVIRRSYWKSVAASSRKDPNITKSDVQNMPIMVPPLERQQKITDGLQSIIESIKKERAYISSLQLLKSSLSADLLSGRKRVSV